MKMLLEMPLEGNDFEELSRLLPEGSYTQVFPKHFDGQTVIQAIVEFAKISIPALVSYFVGRKSLVNITWKYSGKVDLEMTAAVNKKELTEQELSNYFYSQIEKYSKFNSSQGEAENESDN